MFNAGSGNDGAHRQVNSFIWVSWTPDVAVTGGLLGVDFASIVWAKINYLASPNLGLLPWYSPPTGNRGVSCAACGCFLGVGVVVSQAATGRQLAPPVTSTCCGQWLAPMHTDSTSPAACSAALKREGHWCWYPICHTSLDLPWGQTADRFK